MKKISVCALIMIMLIVIAAPTFNVAEAATSRVAIISSYDGTVEIQKSGGKKTLKAFKNMSLNQGDTVTTGKKSSATLKFSNGTSEDDTFTLESNTTVSFTKVTNSKGTVTKVKLLKGKVWVDVKSIQNADDAFELETPTAIMGVRGTYFAVGVDPSSGTSTLIVLSGIVQAQGSANGSGASPSNLPSNLVYPATGIVIGNINPSSANSNGIQGEIVPNTVLPLNNAMIETFLQNSSSEVINNLLANQQKIIDENNELIQQLAAGGNIPPAVQSLPFDLQQYTPNVNNILLALLEAAKAKGLATQDQINQVAGTINGPTLPQNMLNEPDTHYVLPTQSGNISSANKLEMLKAQEALKRLEQQNYNANLQKKLNQLQEEKLKKAAEEKWLASLSEQERLAYLQAKLNKELEASGQAPSSGSSSGGTSPSPAPTPTPTGPASWDEVIDPLFITYDDGSNLENVSYELVKDSYYAAVYEVVNGFTYVNIMSNLDDITINSVMINADESAQYNETTKEYSFNLGDGTQEYRLDIQLSHPSLGTKDITLMVMSNRSLWEKIEEPIQLSLQHQGSTQSLAYSKEGVTNYYATISQDVDDSYQFVIESNDASIDIVSVVVDENEIPPVDDGQYGFNLRTSPTEYNIEIELIHPQYGYTRVRLYLVY